MLGRRTKGIESGLLLPTPLASNTKAHHMRSGGRPARSYVNWPTPSSNSGTGGAVGLAGGSGNRKRLYDMLGEEEGKKMGCQSLNPNWVEWLMQWPIEWTDLKPLGTGRCRSVQQWRGKF